MRVTCLKSGRHPRGRWRSSGVAALLLILAMPCFADDGWDRLGHAVSLFGCIALLIGAASAVWSRMGAILLFVIVGGPSTYLTVEIVNDNAESLWVAYLICYFVFLICCSIGVLRSVGNAPKQAD